MPHLHLDPVGGVAGDMFAAALLSLDPSLDDAGLTTLVRALRDAGLAPDVDVRVEHAHDDVFVGRRFVVSDPREQRRVVPGRFVVMRDLSHAHVPWADIRERLRASSLDEAVKGRAEAIFTLLAEAEASVHGAAIDDVAFHEVGAQDSIADVVTAAWLVEELTRRLGPITWSTSSLPLGNGRVQTAHGELPVPAPAALKLLDGFPTHDDGRMGERVTPTGAAILRHLLGARPSTRRPPARVGATGIGFGTKRFAGISNILRVTLLQPDARDDDVIRRSLCVVRFEVDDQSAEELAQGLEIVRAMAGVLDVVQVPAFGKKGRMTSQVQVLALPDVVDDVARACLVQTTTLGVRVEHVERLELAREEQRVDGVRVKSVVRPGGVRTAKADVDDVTGPSAAARAQTRRHAEAGALAGSLARSEAHDARADGTRDG